MAKKIMPAWRAPYLAKSSHRWEIRYYQTDPATGKLTLHRETRDINRITQQKYGAEWIAMREALARDAIRDITKRLPEGYPYAQKKGLTIEAAFRKIIDLKTRTDKEETVRSYRSMGGVFLAWLEISQYRTLDVQQFGRRHATEFMDYVLIERKVGNRTWNNYAVNLASFCNEMVKRDMTAANPFSKLGKKPSAPAARRKFTEHERAVVASYMYQHHYYMFLFVMLEFYGLMRGTEIRRLTPDDFRLQDGFIYLAPSKSKTGKERWITIPRMLHESLLDERFISIPVNYYVFGWNLSPGARMATRNQVYNAHQRILRELLQSGALEDIKNLSPYSWKNTGITEWLKTMPLSEVMRQAGHTDPRTTMIYYRPDLMNHHFRNTDVKVF